MKFAFIGYDYTLDIAIRLIEDGHELIHIFTFPCDNQFSFNKHLLDFAAGSNIPCTIEKITQGHIDYCLSQGCKAFLSAGYPHKIPVIDDTQAYCINLHPAFLPRGRGIMPLPNIIMNEPDAAGFTLHKLSERIDAGDILYQEQIKIDSNTDVETLSAKIALACPDAASKLFENIDEYWKNAKPQDENRASYYPPFDEKSRTLDWNSNANTLMSMSRAFGRFGVVATITNNIGQSQKLAVFDFTAWQDHHDKETGILLRSSNKEIIMTISNGYACLKDFTVIT